MFVASVYERLTLIIFLIFSSSGLTQHRKLHSSIGLRNPVRSLSSHSLVTVYLVPQLDRLYDGRESLARAVACTPHIKIRHTRFSTC
jgi:hypothetical protein